MGNAEYMGHSTVASPMNGTRRVRPDKKFDMVVETDRSMSPSTGFRRFADAPPSDEESDALQQRIGAVLDADVGTSPIVAAGNDIELEPLTHGNSAVAFDDMGGDVAERTYFGTSLWRLYWERTLWLVGLLLLQSYASLILESFEALLQKHLVITLFLPMLIGAGGNASNQSAMLVVRGLAMGEVTRHNFTRLIAREFTLAFVIGGTMMAVAYARVYLFHSSEGNSAALAVGAATMAVMLLAIGLGTLIPLLMDFVRIDPAHSGPVVAVMVDLCGVAIICYVCFLILPS